MKVCKNSRTHYCGIPNKDEVMDFFGEISSIILFIIVLVVFYKCH